MNTLLVPISQPCFNLCWTFGFLTSVHFGQQESELLSEGVQALPPMTVAVLVSIAREKLVEEFINVDEHSFVML